MLRAVVSRSNGRTLLLFGLRHEELDYLQKDGHFVVALDEVGVPGEAVFFAAEDHAEMAAQLERAGVLPEEVLARVARGGRVTYEWRR